MYNIKLDHSIGVQAERFGIPKERLDELAVLIDDTIRRLFKTENVVQATHILEQIVVYANNERELLYMGFLIGKIDAHMEGPIEIESKY